MQAGNFEAFSVGRWLDDSSPLAGTSRSLAELLHTLEGPEARAEGSDGATRQVHGRLLPWGDHLPALQTHLPCQPG